MGKIIGIDLGTTNSVVAVMEGGEPTVIPNLDGNRVTPSVVAFTESGDRLVGQIAKRQAVTNPRNTVFSIKRFMGRRHNEVQDEEKMVPYEVVGGSEEAVRVNLQGKDYTPPEISALTLQSLKEAAEAYLGTTITEAVITVPAYFNDSQRQATKDAGRIAGLDVKRIINEPTAAALAYGLNRKGNEKIVVYDLGGGTFDVSILEVDDGIFKVLSTNGDTHLGGDDFDEVLIRHIASEFQKDQGIDLRQDLMALQRLKEAAEKAKCELSSRTETDINLPYITADATGAKHLQMQISRATFENLAKELVQRTRRPCELALSDAGLSASEIDEVVLVGGSTRIPAIQATVKEIFGKEPNRSVNPDEVVAMGAAIQGGILAGDEQLNEVLLLDVTPLSLGIETLGSVTTRLIERNTTIPTKKSEVFSTAEDNQSQVEIHVLQGEREMASFNRTLGRFNLTGIPSAPSGTPQIEVTFDIDANGIVHVSAKDRGTGNEQKIEIKSSSGLSDDEVKQMVDEAEAHADEDTRLRALADARNQGEARVNEAERQLKDHGDNVDAALKSELESAIQAARESQSGEDPASIEAATEKVTAALHKVSEQVYQRAAAEQQGAGDAGEETVEDADYEVIDEDEPASKA